MEKTYEKAANSPSKANGPRLAPGCPLDKFPWERFPWDEWLNGGKWGIEKPDMNGATIKQFIEYARLAADERGVGLLIRPHGDKAVFLQARPKSERRCGRLLDYLERNGGRLPWRQVLRNLHYSAADLRAAVEVLVARGEVLTDALVEDGRVMRPGTYIEIDDI